MVMRIGIIGAGISGLACAQQLKSQGFDVRLFDKGKRPGGRLASVAIGGMAWDIGALGFVAKGPEFRRQVEQWHKAGWLAVREASAPDVLAGVPAMATLVAAQCADLDIRFGANVYRIEKDSEGWLVSGRDFADGPFSALMIAVPAEQAAALLSLHDLAMARQAAMVRSSPCWALMLAFSQEAPISKALIAGSAPFAAVARSRAAQVRTANDCWTFHADEDWSSAHLERSREEVAELLVASLTNLVGCSLPPIRFAKAHRWRFAIPSGGPGASLWNDRLRLGACGDWCLGSTVETAWLSGNGLALQAAQALDGSMNGNAAERLA